jgi:K+-transporting ATPase ATPase C chain
MKDWLAELGTSVKAVALLAVIFCGLYPATVWLLAQGLFADRANGSLLVRDGKIIGSALIGQPFSGPGYFHPRPSDAGRGYDAMTSGGSNLGPISRDLVETVGRRVAEYRKENALPAGLPVPADAVTASASGLDPHVSVENALLQAPRVAKARGLSEAEVRRLLGRATEGRTMGILGTPRVNVLLLNLALDGVNDAGR